MQLTGVLEYTEILANLLTYIAIADTMTHKSAEDYIEWRNRPR